MIAVEFFKRSTQKTSQSCGRQTSTSKGFKINLGIHGLHHPLCLISYPGIHDPPPPPGFETWYPNSHNTDRNAAVKTTVGMRVRPTTAFTWLSRKSAGIHHGGRVQLQVPLAFQSPKKTNSRLKNLQLSILSKGVQPNLPFFHHSLPKPDTVSMWNSSKRLASSPQGPWDGITDSPWNAIEKNRLKITCLVFSFFSTLRVLLHHLCVLSYLFVVIVAVLWLRLVFACSGSPHPHDEIDYKSKSQEGSTDPQKVALRRYGMYANSK